MVFGRIGVMEYWNDGLIAEWLNGYIPITIADIPIFHSSSIKHHSNTPVLQFFPQSSVLCNFKLFAMLINIRLASKFGCHERQ